MVERKVEVRSKSVCYDGFLRLEQVVLRHGLFAGGMSPKLKRELMERGDAVSLLPYDPVTDQLVLIEQFRIGALRHQPDNPWLMEIVAGVIDEGESPEEVARREAHEEAGLVVTQLESICHYLVSPGGTSEAIHLFCGRVDASKAGGIHGLADEHEDIQVHVIPAAEASAWLADGRINSASPIIALQWFVLNHAELRRRWLENPAN